ncbi:MAG: hypothetical protein ABII26_07120 [Pseudomonadota bacterium]
MGERRGIGSQMRVIVCDAGQATFSCAIEYIWKFKPKSIWINNGLNGFRSLDLLLMSKAKQVCGRRLEVFMPAKAGIQV